METQISQVAAKLLGNNEKIETDDESFEMIPEPNEAGNTKHSQAYVIDHCKQSRNWDFW